MNEREVVEGERAGGPVRAVVARRRYATSPEDLWDALTNPERIPRWFLPISGDVGIGGRWKLEGNAGGTVLACDPPRAFSVTWEYGGDVSWVDVTLRAVGDATELELRHAARPSPHWAQFGPGAVGVGWDLGLEGLARHLATGAPVDPAAAAAWAASPEGRAFQIASSEGWGAAAIAAGEAPETARAAVSATTAFYLGEG
jgi:uncharacterized protein YndB with AHSA1/START domain